MTNPLILLCILLSFVVLLLTYWIVGLLNDNQEIKKYKDLGYKVGN